MEATFVVEGSASTMTPEFAAQIQAAIVALPAAYQAPLQESELVESPEATQV